jgi:hypothetical protein
MPSEIAGLRLAGKCRTSFRAQGRPAFRGDKSNDFCGGGNNLGHPAQTLL